MHLSVQHPAGEQHPAAPESRWMRQQRQRQPGSALMVVLPQPTHAAANGGSAQPRATLISQVACPQQTARLASSCVLPQRPNRGRAQPRRPT